MKKTTNTPLGLYPEFKKWSYKKLEKELKQFQKFLNEENSSIGRQDMYYEQALIQELELRDKKNDKSNKKRKTQKKSI